MAPPLPGIRLVPFLLVLVLATWLSSTRVFAQCEEARIVPADVAAEDRFGRTVDLEGDLLVAGSIFDDDGGDRAGSAYVFVRGAGGEWSEEAKLLAPDPEVDHQFGTAVALSGDTVIVGAPNDDTQADRAGAAYVFRRTEPGTWSLEQKITAPDGAALEFLGRSVGIDGDLAVVGAPEDDDGAVDAGSAYLFRRDGQGTWSLEQKITASDPIPLARFGGAADVSGDLAVIGATGDDQAGPDAGAAYAFSRDGGPWAEEAKLLPQTSVSALFGSALDLEANLLVVGAFQDNPSGNGSGSAWVFGRGGAGVWQLGARLVASDARSQSGFGSDVAIDGMDIAVGAFRARAESGRSGATYVFLGDGHGSFVEHAKLVSERAADNDHEGFAVALDGGRLAVGARLHDVGPRGNVGAVSVFRGVDPACLCMPGRANDGDGAVVDLLFVNGSSGGPDRTVVSGETDLLVAYVLRPPADGNGKFVVHANDGAPSRDGLRVLPFDVGTTCFPMILPEATPIGIWNNIGRRNRIGASHDLGGNPLEDPPPAPSIFLQLFGGDPKNLPVGSEVTFQGAVIDPGATSDRGAATTNAVVLRIE